MTWDSIVDLEQALTNCHIDLIRDWHYDPWGWPEHDWVAKEKPEIAYRRLNVWGARPVAKFDAAKENLSIRPAVVLDPVDRLIYRTLVDCVSRSLIGGLRTSVFGWRLPPDDGTPPGPVDGPTVSLTGRVTTVELHRLCVSHGESESICIQVERRQRSTVSPLENVSPSCTAPRKSWSAPRRRQAADRPPRNFRGVGRLSDRTRIRTVCVWLAPPRQPTRRTNGPQ
jgi:hypothetical protein